MRRIVMVGVLVALLVALFAVPALARNFQCTDFRCEGTNQSDNIIERAGDNVHDQISGLRGADTIRAEVFSGDVDIVNGNRGNDWLYTNDGDGLDEAHGGPGFDRCFVDPGDETFSCEVVRVS
jgi:hypothetical protein